MDTSDRVVRVVRIDQPQVRNAINGPTAARLHDELLAFDADPDARVAVVTGDAPTLDGGDDGLAELQSGRTERT